MSAEPRPSARGSLLAATLAVPAAALAAALSTHVRTGLLVPAFTTESVACLAALAAVVARGRGLPFALGPCLALAGVAAGIVLQPYAGQDYRWWMLPFAAAFVSGTAVGLLPRVGLVATFALVPLLGAGIGIGMPAGSRTIGDAALGLAPGAAAACCAAAVGWLASRVRGKTVDVLARVAAAWTAAAALMAGVMLWRSLSSLASGSLI